jgi:hypothetical protein
VKKLGFVLLVGIALLGIYRTAFGAPSENAGKLIFTEVSFRNSINDWVEIYVVDGSIDWTGYRIYEGGELRKTLLSELGEALSTGDYIVFHEETGIDETTDKGANGYWDIYGLTYLYATDLILQIKEPSGSTARVDVVIYSDDDGDFTSSEIEANDAVTDGMWTSYDFTTGDAGAWTDSDSISETESLARYRIAGSPYADNDSKTDWYEETSTTPGANNNQETAITLSSLTAHPTLSQATFFPWQWLALAGAVVAFGGVLWRGGCLSDREDSTRGIKSW